MSHRSFQIEIYKEQLECFSKMSYQEFLHITDEQLKELLSKIPFKDAFEMHYIIARMIYLNSDSSTEDDMLLTHIMDVLSTENDEAHILALFYSINIILCTTYSVIMYYRQYTKLEIMAENLERIEEMLRQEIAQDLVNAEAVTLEQCLDFTETTDLNSTGTYNGTGNR